MFYSFRLIIVIAISLSLSLVAGPAFGGRTPSLVPVHAIPQPCDTTGSTGACSEFWYPAGPGMDNEAILITNSGNEYACILNTSPCLDLPDSVIPAASASACNASNTLYLTAVVSGLQFCYVRCQTGPCNTSNSWVRVVNAVGSGLPNYFTWLNVWNPAPATGGTIRQGFSSTTSSVNVYDARTVWDTYVVGGIYDSLLVANPLSPTQLVNWMVYTVVKEDNATVMATSNYSPPAGTLTTYHFILRNDLFFQDGRPVTSYDVAFSYMSLVGSGAILGNPASSMTGLTVLGPRAFDIGVNSLGFLTLPHLTSIPIVPGRYWTNAGSSVWDSAIAACTQLTPCAKAQYTLSGPTVTCLVAPHPGCASFPAGNMQVDPTKTTPVYDPLANHILVGSGPWECGPVTSSGSGNCSSSVVQNPPVGGSYTMTRFGKGLAPVSSISSIYFRSSGGLAIYNWSEENDLNPLAPVSAISVCFGQPVNPVGPCAHWQKGIGASSTGVVGLNQVSIVELRYSLNWVAPFEWAASPPLGIGPFSPVLYEGSITLNPCSIDPVNGYDC